MCITHMKYHLYQACEKNLDNVVAQKFMCRWPAGRNPRTKPFTHAKEKDK